MLKALSCERFTLSSIIQSHPSSRRLFSVALEMEDTSIRLLQSKQSQLRERERDRDREFHFQLLNKYSVFFLLLWIFDGSLMGETPQSNEHVKSCFVNFSYKLQNTLKSQLNKLINACEDVKSASSQLRTERELPGVFEIDQEKQLQAWRQNPSWVSQPPEIKVTVPKGSLSCLNAKVDLGLPPDAVYNIVTDPDNKRVFKNIKEVISRRVLTDDGPRQVVEVEQAALWKFLWWSGTISVHLLVDQNRQDHTMKFKQLKTGFMNKFEGCWRIEPVLIDEKMCLPFEPKTQGEYYSCTGGKGRIGSRVSLEQLIEPAVVPPPPISWYLRGITTKTTEMLIHDLMCETARIREGLHTCTDQDEAQILLDENGVDKLSEIKERWLSRRKMSKQQQTRRRRRG